MDSILDKILTQRHAEEIRGFDPVAVIQGLLRELSDREREVITRRFGLPGSEKVETLEQIGATLKVTRERVRQITKSSLSHLTIIASKQDDVQRFARVAEHLLRSYGGALEEHYFVHQLLDFANITTENHQWVQANTALRFLLDYIVINSVEHRAAAVNLKSLYTLKSAETKLLAGIAASIVAKVEASGQPLPSDELVQQFRSSPIYQQDYKTI